MCASTAAAYLGVSVQTLKKMPVQPVLLLGTKTRRYLREHLDAMLRKSDESRSFVPGSGAAEVAALQARLAQAALRSDIPRSSP
jgi:hypothetical protein